MQIHTSKVVVLFAFIACSGVYRSAEAQTFSGPFVGMADGAVAVNDAGTVRTIPIRSTAVISIRGEVDFAEIPKGAQVVLRGRIPDGSKSVENWSVTYHPLSRPISAITDRTEGSPNGGSYWDLNLFCTVLSTSPFRVQVLPGNEYSLSVYDPVTRIYGLGAYRGPKMDGMTIALEDGKRSRRGVTEIEFGPNPQFAGKGATVTVTVGGVPPMAETVFVRRVEPFTVPQKITPSRPVRTTAKPSATKPTASPNN